MDATGQLVSMTGFNLKKLCAVLLWLLICWYTPDSGNLALLLASRAHLSRALPLKEVARRRLFSQVSFQQLDSINGQLCKRRLDTIIKLVFEEHVLPYVLCHTGPPILSGPDKALHP